VGGFLINADEKTCERSRKNEGKERGVLSQNRHFINEEVGTRKVGRLEDQIATEDKKSTGSTAMVVFSGKKCGFQIGHEETGWGGGTLC